MVRVALLLVWTVCCAYAQVSTATLFGVVLDPSGGAVSDATVSIQLDGSVVERRGKTNSLGEFRFADLPPGSYSVTAGKNGFRTTKSDGVVLAVNQTGRLTMQLQVGSASDSITVSSRVSPVQTEDATQGYYLQSRLISSLPVLGRNVVSLTTLPAAAVPRHLGGFVHDVVNDVQAGRGAVALNSPVNGARSSANAFVLDGVYNTDRNAYAIAVNPPMESVQEFRIVTSLAGAQYPQAGGGLMDIVTKSGSREFHGSAFEYLRNEATDARNLFDQPDLPKPAVRQNQFGGSLGGPLAGGSTFFFGTYEALRGRSAKSTLHLFPDATLRSGDFSGSAPLFDPLTIPRQPFPGNRIPAARISPIARKYLDTYEPLPNLNSGGGSNYLDATANENHNQQGSLRVDHSLGTRGTLFARYTINDDDTQLAGAFPERPTHEQLRAQQVSIGHSAAGASWVNDARVSFTRLRVFDVPQSAFQSDVIKDLGIPGFPSDPFQFGLPYFVITDFETVTDSTFLPQLQRDNSWYFADRFSRTRGRLTFHAGLEFHDFQMNYLQSRFPRGQYIFNGAFTSADGTGGDSGDAFADFLLGYAQRTTRTTGNAQAYLRQHAISGYGQADWKLTPRLTINAGLRYEYLSPFSEKRGQLLNLDYSTLPRAPRLIAVNSASEPNRTNFAPRVGFAYQLPRSTVLRGGYGLYYSPDIAAEAYDLVRNGIRNEINQASGLIPTLTLANGFPGAGAGGSPNYYGADRRLSTPYVQQWNFGLQKEIFRATVLEATYTGTKGTHLGRFRQFNTPLHVETGENLAPRPGDLQSLRTFPDLGPIIQRQHIANSSYNALQLKVERHLSKKFTMSVNFAWAKSIDDADGVIPGQYDSIGAQDERNLRLERGLSFFDVRRRLSAAFLYQLPGRRLSIFTRDWTLSGILTFQDGTPLNPVYFGTDIANTGTPNRPNVVYGQKAALPANERTLDRYFNTDAFTTPAPYTFGNAGRNTLPGPGNQVVDLALYRRFAIRERLALDVRAESFNALNHPNIGIPGPYPDFGPFFGKIFSSGDPRRFQFALRLEF